MTTLRDARGHVWKHNEDGKPDDMAYDRGSCTGPVCIRCGFYYCTNCLPGGPTKDCPGMLDECQEKLYIEHGPALVSAVSAMVSHWLDGGEITATLMTDVRGALHDITGFVYDEDSDSFVGGVSVVREE